VRREDRGFCFIFKVSA